MSETAWTDEKARMFTAPCVDRAQWDAWLAAHDAKVRRTAAREALDGLAGEARAVAESEKPLTERTLARLTEGWALNYRDDHYKEVSP